MKRLPSTVLDDNWEILKGRKEIMAFLKVKSWRTIQRYRKIHHLPILEWVNGRPMALKTDLIRYLIVFNEIIEKKRKKDDEPGEK